MKPNRSRVRTYINRQISERGVLQIYKREPQNGSPTKLLLTEYTRLFVQLQQLKGPSACVGVL